jgi:hypothetical protein
MRATRSVVVGLVLASAAAAVHGADAPKPPLVPDPGAAGPSKAFTVDFEPTGGTEAKERPLPDGFVVVDGTWSVTDDPLAPGKNRVLLQEKTVEDYAVVVVTGEGRALADGKVTVRFLPVSGRDDAAGGIVFRASSAGDYYLVRANALEDNLRLYVVKGGVRVQLATTTVKPPVMGEWHTIEVEFRGDSLRAVLNGRDVVATKDSTWKAGWCGLWTKADAVTRFDDLVVTPDGATKDGPVPPPAPPSPPSPVPAPEEPSPKK